MITSPGAPSWHWLLIFGSSFALAAGAYALAGWMGWAIYTVALLFAAVVISNAD